MNRKESQRKPNFAPCRHDNERKVRPFFSFEGGSSRTWRPQPLVRAVSTTLPRSCSACRVLRVPATQTTEQLTRVDQTAFCITFLAFQDADHARLGRRALMGAEDYRSNGYMQSTSNGANHSGRINVVSTRDLETRRLLSIRRVLGVRASGKLHGGRRPARQATGMRRAGGQYAAPPGCAIFIDTVLASCRLAVPCVR